MYPKPDERFFSKLKSLAEKESDEKVLTLSNKTIAQMKKANEEQSLGYTIEVMGQGSTADYSVVKFKYGSNRNIAALWTAIAD